MTRAAAFLSAILFLAACAARQAPAPDIAPDVLNPDVTMDVAPLATADVPINRSAPDPTARPEPDDTREDAPETRDPKPDKQIEHPGPMDDGRLPEHLPIP